VQWSGRDYLPPYYLPYTRTGGGTGNVVTLTGQCSCFRLPLAFVACLIVQVDSLIFVITNYGLSRDVLGLLYITKMAVFWVVAPCSLV
jgi:hypothetical protein